MEAISHAGTVLGVLTKQGIVLAAEKKVTGKLLDLSSAKEGGYGGSGEKIFLLNSCVPNTINTFTCMPDRVISRNVLAGVAGVTADANSLVNYARQAAQQHLFSYNEDIPVEQLAQRLCDLKQGYTQHGGAVSSVWLDSQLLTQVVNRSTTIRCIPSIRWLRRTLSLPTLSL